jgi:hypothetical protein
MAIVLMLHIIFGITSIVLCAIGLLDNRQAKHLANRIFLPSIVAVLGSGGALVLLGGSIGRACISATVMIVVLVSINRYSSIAQATDS